MSMTFFHFKVERGDDSAHYVVRGMPSSSVILTEDAQYGIRVALAEQYRVHRDQVVPISAEEYEAALSAARRIEREASRLLRMIVPEKEG